ncbi:hypothetical protein EGR_05254 [Echinococcus granulosus]|uniref:Uncharacterized protein n=1 Tax=Echinococcus granulosus TaxID=6210 RepID=W6UFP9_ECHGR|nr:hypothetical protein EGR_05254 [Echinococcus granulosus]EUB59928.1 hypothetical protein EGR_05254 [Echinococcus granulosus]
MTWLTNISLVTENCCPVDSNAGNYESRKFTTSTFGHLTHEDATQSGRFSAEDVNIKCLKRVFVILVGQSKKAICHLRQSARGIVVISSEYEILRKWITLIKCSEYISFQMPTLSMRSVNVYLQKLCANIEGLIYLPNREQWEQADETSSSIKQAPFYSYFHLIGSVLSHCLAFDERSRNNSPSTKPSVLTLTSLPKALMHSHFTNSPISVRAPTVAEMATHALISTQQAFNNCNCMLPRGCPLLLEYQMMGNHDQLSRKSCSLNALATDKSSINRPFIYPFTTTDAAYCP